MTDPLHTPVGTPRRLKDILPGEAARIVAADPRLVIPVGTCESHGPHLPYGTSTIIAEALAEDLSAAYSVLLAPTVEYGVNVPTESDTTGSGCMRKKTLHRVLNDLLASWERSGFREFILLTAADADAHQEALATVITTTARVRVVDIHAVNVADLLEGQREHLHGDEVETSLMLYLAPKLVQMEWAVDTPAWDRESRRYRRGRLRVPKDGTGSFGRPTLASAAKGQRIYDRVRQRISERIFLTPTLDG